MLEKLTIKNYALIDSVEIEFHEGLSIITGETGSGKSIMLGALSLLTGGRADSRVIRQGEKKAVIEATFNNPAPELMPIVENAGADWSSEVLIVRRELGNNGRSRAFVNDSPVTLQTLQMLMPSLIDIHSQHHNLQLIDPRRQLAIVDTIAGNSDILAQYRAIFGEYARLRQQIEQRRRERERNRENREFMLFQLEQLEKLKPKRGELEALERDYDIYSDATEIRESLAKAAGSMGCNENSAVSLLADARSELGKVDLSLFEDSEEQPGLMQRIESLYVELKDVADTLEGFATSIDCDPAKLTRISARMDKLYEAQKRFKVESNDELVEFHERLKKSIGGPDGSDTELEDMEARLRDLAKSLKSKATELSASRQAAAEEFSEMLTATAIPLGLPNLKFSVVISKGKLHSDGMDRVEFLCRFNKNQELMALEKVASGGELSRLMLSLKEILSSKLRQPTVVFDEIDTGVSGEIADRMGRMMREMGKSTQVIAITHLPQVASKGATHYKVYKEDTSDSTVTRVEQLDKQRREAELAKMLSGDKVDVAALENAKSLLENK